MGREKFEASILSQGEVDQTPKIVPEPLQTSEERVDWDMYGQQFKSLLGELTAHSGMLGKRRPSFIIGQPKRVAEIDYIDYAKSVPLEQNGALYKINPDMPRQKSELQMLFLEEPVFATRPNKDKCTVAEAIEEIKKDYAVDQFLYPGIEVANLFLWSEHKPFFRSSGIVLLPGSLVRNMQGEWGVIGVKFSKQGLKFELQFVPITQPLGAMTVVVLPHRKP